MCASSDLLFRLTFLPRFDRYATWRVLFIRRLDEAQPSEARTQSAPVDRRTAGTEALGLKTLRLTVL